MLFLLCFSSVSASVVTRHGSDFKIVGDKISFKINDKLGSDRLTLNGGEVVAESNVLPYGQPIKNNNVKFGFTGKELDSTDNYYFNARYYDYDSGKFLGVDPVSDNHAYSYVSNNPMNYVDPSGMDDFLIIGADKDHYEKNFKVRTRDSEGFSGDDMSIGEVMAEGGHTYEYYDLYSGEEFFELLDSLKLEGKSFDRAIIAGHGLPTLLGKIHFDEHEDKMDNDYSSLVKGDIYLNSCSAGSKCGDPSSTWMYGPSNADFLAWLFKSDNVYGPKRVFFGIVVLDSENFVVSGNGVSKFVEAPGFSRFSYVFLPSQEKHFKYGFYPLGDDNFLRVMKIDDGSYEFSEASFSTGFHGRQYSSSGNSVEAPEDYDERKVFHQESIPDWFRFSQPEEKPFYTYQ